MNGNVFSIAAQLGWTASAQYKEGRLFFDFQRKTLSGVPFTFTAEMKDGKVSNLVKEIESFVEAIEPETCASEWMVQSGAVAPSRFRQAVSDMDAIRTDAWLLACQLAEADGNPSWQVCPGASGTEFRDQASPKVAFYSRGLSLNLRPLLGRPASL